MNKNYSKENIKNYWDFQPCGVKYCPHQEGTREFFEFTEERRKKLEPFIENFAEFNKWKDKKVLEIGCGVGVDTLKFAKNGAKIFAIDISPKSVALAKKRLDYNALDGEIAVSDAENLPFLDNQFDFVYSWGVLHHTPDIKKAVSEVFRVLKTGGRFCVMLYNRRSLVGLQLYLLYGLLKFRPFRRLKDVFADHLESPGTKALIKAEIEALFSIFPTFKIDTVVTPYDVRIGKRLFLPRVFQRLIPKKIGFFFIITGEKS